MSCARADDALLNTIRQSLTSFHKPPPGPRKVGPAVAAAGIKDSLTMAAEELPRGIEAANRNYQPYKQRIGVWLLK